MSVSPNPPKKGDIFTIEADVIFSKKYFMIAQYCILLYMIVQGFAAKYRSICILLKVYKCHGSMLICCLSVMHKLIDHMTLCMCIGEQVTGGELELNVYINNTDYISGNFDLCSSITMVGLECPISAGLHTLTGFRQISADNPSVRLSTCVLNPWSFNHFQHAWHWKTGNRAAEK